jgi:hypothetical protein
VLFYQRKNPDKAAEVARIKELNRDHAVRPAAAPCSRD